LDARARGACAAVLVLGACAPSLDWREIRAGGGAAAVMLPCKPNLATRSVQLAGQPARMSMLSCKAGELSWSLATADLGDPTRVGPALKALPESIRANIGGETVESRPARVRGATPHEAQVRVVVRGRRQDGAPIAAQVVVFSYGTQVFQAVVMGERVPEEAAAVFFDSLHAGS